MFLTLHVADWSRHPGFDEKELEGLKELLTKYEIFVSAKHIDPLDFENYDELVHWYKERHKHGDTALLKHETLIRKLESMDDETILLVYNQVMKFRKREEIEKKQIRNF
ncbi:MAG: hypothetical protein ACXAEU_23220 [Candidatus Hodarchaeales archaeon]|jgi:hypothetical protein